MNMITSRERERERENLQYRNERFQSQRDKDNY